MPSLTKCLENLEGRVELWPWLEEARRIREQNFGLWVETCAIVNAKSGLCPSDCKFCAQSRFWFTRQRPIPSFLRKSSWPKWPWPPSQASIVLAL